MKYRVFIRSARNWTEFAQAHKRTVRTGLTYQEAQAFCQRWNAERSRAQIRHGTKAEFEGV